MKYQIIRPFFGEGGFVDISQESFYEIKSAKKGLDVATSIEQKFYIVSENFFDMEMEYLRLSQRELMSRG